MKMKKVLATAIAAAIICTTMAGCTQNDKTVNGETTTNTTTSAEELTTAPAEEGSVAEASTEESTSQSETTTGTAEAKTSSTVANSTTSATSATAATSAKASAKATTTAKATGTTSRTTAKVSAAQNSKTTTRKSETTKKTTTKKTVVVNKATTKPADNVQTTESTTENTDIIITLGKNGSAECDSSNVTIETPSGLRTDGVVTIEKSGNYIIKSASADVWHGQIIVSLPNTEKAELRFENVNISTSKANAIKILDANIVAERTFIEADLSVTNTTTGADGDNALQDQMKEVSKIQKAPDVDLSFPTGTKSTFTTTSNTMSGVIYNESKLTIKGNGSVDIITNSRSRNNAICSTKSVTFKNVSATLVTANNNVPEALSSARGIFSFSRVEVESGNLVIRSNGDGIRCEELNIKGGTTSISSSASDGIDADDTIIVTDGSIKAIAKKSAFKVRRVNNQENLNAGDTKVKENDGITKPDHTFRIDGGTVIGEGKNMTTPKQRKSIQTVSKQACIYSHSVAPGSELAKLTLSFTINQGSSSIASSGECVKYLYSSPSIDRTKSYSVTGKNGSKTFTNNVTFDSYFGNCSITAS